MAVQRGRPGALAGVEHRQAHRHPRARQRVPVLRRCADALRRRARDDPAGHDAAGVADPQLQGRRRRRLPDERHGRGRGPDARHPADRDGLPGRDAGPAAVPQPGWSYFTWKPAGGLRETGRRRDGARATRRPIASTTRTSPGRRWTRRPRSWSGPSRSDFDKLDEMLALPAVCTAVAAVAGVRVRLHEPQLPASDRHAGGGHTRSTTRSSRSGSGRSATTWTRKGFTNDQWAFYWVDEPGDDSFLKLVVPASKLAKEVDPTILIWEDHQVSLKMLEAHPRRHRHPLLPAELLPQPPRDSGPRVGREAAQLAVPVRQFQGQRPAPLLPAASPGLDPAGPGRGRHVGLGRRAAGSSATTTGRTPATAWSTPPPTARITGKRREAWREGIEDVELFRHLRTLAEKTGDAALKALHDDGLKQVLKTQAAHGQNFGTVADLMALRAQILKTVSVRR